MITRGLWWRMGFCFFVSQLMSDVTCLQTALSVSRIIDDVLQLQFLSLSFSRRGPWNKRFRSQWFTLLVKETSVGTWGPADSRYQANYLCGQLLLNYHGRALKTSVKHMSHSLLLETEVSAWLQRTGWYAY